MWDLQRPDVIETKQETRKQNKAEQENTTIHFTKDISKTYHLTPCEIATNKTTRISVRIFYDFFIQ